METNTLQVSLLENQFLWGGSLARNVATGLGNAYCIREAAKILKLNLKRATVVLQGFGNASTFSGEYLEKMGAKCIAASDSKGSILVPKGFKVSKLLEHKEKKGCLLYTSPSPRD